MKKKMSAPLVGASTLLTVFAVLCLTVFALLSLSTVQAEQRLSESAAQAVTDYYAAELEAQTVFARLRSGERVPGVWEDAGVFCYSVPISAHQALVVELEDRETGWQILKWQTVADPVEVETGLPVWDGK